MFSGARLTLSPLSSSAAGCYLRLRAGVGAGQMSPIPTPVKLSTPTDSNPGLDSDSAALFMTAALCMFVSRRHHCPQQAEKTSMKVIAALAGLYRETQGHRRDPPAKATTTSSSSHLTRLTVIQLRSAHSLWFGPVASRSLRFR